MKKEFYIVKALFLSRLNFLAKKKNFRKTLVIVISAVIVLVFYLIQKLAMYLFELHIPPLSSLPFYIINLAVLSLFIFMFFGSITTVLSVFYLANDIPLLLSAPISEREIFSGKFLYVVIEESLYSIVFVLPFFTALGLIKHLSIVYFLFSFLFCISLPILPIVFALFIVISIANKVSSRKLQSVSILINVLLGISIYMLTQIMNPAYGFFKNRYITDAGRKILIFSKFSPSWVAAEFSVKFAQGNIFIGSLIIISFVSVNILLFYLSYTVASGRYIKGLFNVQKVERISVKHNRAIDHENTTIRALVYKDSRMLMRDARAKVLLLSGIAYLTFFIIPFIIAFEKGSSSGFLFSTSIVFLMMIYVIADNYFCGQNALVNLFIDRESIWIILSSPLKASVFYWSKFLPPFIFGVAVNFMLLILFVVLLGVKSYSITMISLPMVVAMPFIFTTTALFIGFYFPNFRSPKDPRKLISGKVSLILAVIDFIYIIVFGVGLPIFLHFVLKFKSLLFVFVISLLIFSAISIIGGFPLIMLSIKRYNNLQIAE